MKHENPSDLIEIRDLFDRFIELTLSQPYEALRFFKAAADRVKELKEEGSEFYQPAAQLLDRCIPELQGISPMLPDIVKGLIDGRDEHWFREQGDTLDRLTAHALLDAYAPIAQ